MNEKELKKLKAQLGKEHRKQEKTDRHPHSYVTYRGDAKKGGYAGKYCWGKEGTGEEGVPYIDESDPNYLSDEEAIGQRKFEGNPKQDNMGPSSSMWEDVLTDYLNEIETDETISKIHERNKPDLHHLLIKRALFLGYERPPFQRELISQLLSKIYPKVVTPEKMEEGFETALEAIEDATLDTPDAPDILSKFLARAIQDEVIPPIFIKTILEKTKKEEVKGVLRMASGILSEPNAGEMLSHVWGYADLQSVKKMKIEAKERIEEYLLSDVPSDVEDFLRTVSSYDTQFVYYCLQMAIEKPEKKDKLVQLLEHLVNMGLIGNNIVELGFKNCTKRIADLRLDNPQAEKHLSKLKESASSLGLISDPQSLSHA